MTVRYSPTKNQDAFDRLGATTGAMTIYVATTGNDNTGTGAVGSPYATVERAFQDLPRYIRHECKILVEAGDYASGWPKSIAPIFEDDGSLAIVGVGTPDVVSGPWTVTGVADLGTGGQRITVGAGGLGAVDSLCGQMVMIATGGHPGMGHMVGANTDTTIDIVLVSDKVHNADTFNLVNPAVKIAADEAALSQQNMTCPAWDGGTWTSKINRLVLHNIWLDLSASPSLAAILRMTETYTRDDGSGLALSFVRVDLPAPVYGGVFASGVTLNTQKAYTDAFITDGATGVINLDGDYQVGTTITHTGDRETYTAYSYGNTSLKYCCIKGSVGTTVGADLQVSAGVWGQLYGKCRVLSGVVVGKTAKIPISVDAVEAFLKNVHILKGSCALKLIGNVRAQIEGLTCDGTDVTGSAVDVGEGASLILIGAHASFVGATGARAAYRFIAPAVDIDGPAWPAAGAGVTDAMGSWINRRS